MNEWVKQGSLKGPPGPIGPPNTLTIGIVTTLEWTEPATAEISGEAPDQILDLGIPQGSPGQAAIEWDDVLGKPVTFPPTLPIPSAGVTGLDTKQASQDAAIAAIDWSTLAGKPVTFPPTLPIAQTGISGLTTDLATLSGQIAVLQSDKAPLANPVLTGDPKAPTAAPGDNDQSIATTAFVKASQDVQDTATAAALALKANLASPVFTGNPTGPTPAVGDNDLSLATTAFVVAALAATGASVGASAPATALGKFWWHPTEKTLRIWDGSAWEPVLATWA